MSLKRLTSGLLFALLILSPLAATAAGSFDQRLDVLERRVDRITDLTLQLQAIQEDNRQLRGQIEQLQHEIALLKRKQRDLYLDIDQRIASLQQTPAPAVPAAPPSTATAATPAAVAAPRPSTPAAADPAREEAEYKAAYALLSPQQRRYQEAVKAFRAFLEKYPHSKLAANAQYWMAEASYVLQDNETALREFQKVVSDYPDSPKVAGALLKIGYIQHALGQRAAAKATLEQVVRDYPNTAVADMAKQRLQRLARETR